MARRRKKKSLHIGETPEEREKRLESERIAEKIQARAHGVLIAMKSKIPNLDDLPGKRPPKPIKPIEMNLTMQRAVQEYTKEKKL